MLLLAVIPAALRLVTTRRVKQEQWWIAVTKRHVTEDMDPVVLREEFAKALDLRQIIIGDIGLRRMQRRVILMIALRGIELVQSGNLGDDRSRIGLCLVQLGDIGVGNLRLILIRGENRRAILRSRIRLRQPPCLAPRISETARNYPNLLS